MAHNYTIIVLVFVEDERDLMLCYFFVSNCSLRQLAPLEAVLFDVDGTLCDTDPIHLIAFREMLLEV